MIRRWLRYYLSPSLYTTENLRWNLALWLADWSQRELARHRTALVQ